MTGLVVAVSCDHSTPVEDKGHSDDPVPVLVLGGKTKPDGSSRFTEREAVKGGLGTLEKGGMLLERLREVAS